eukprot:5759274-Heterocapsa_arctica.AAC.1
MPVRLELRRKDHHRQAVPQEGLMLGNESNMYEGKEMVKFIKYNKDKLAEMSVLEQIGTLTVYMIDKPIVRKPLSKLGALRISRQERQRLRRAL